MKKNIIVTGGAGFLGSNLCRFLCQKGEKVTVIDNLYSGKMENLCGLEKFDFHFINADVIDKLNFDEKIDEIYHLACPASPPFYQNKPIFTAKTCFLGALNMLELAKEHDAKILLSSTSEVYGEPEVHPQVETYRGNVNPIGIRSCYDEGKRVAETLFFDYHREYNLRIKVIRIFNTYGPYMRFDDGRVVTNFIYQALNDLPVTIYGDGSQTRSFCYVDDLIDGIVAMNASADDFLGPVNLGNPSEYTVKELAEKIIELCNSKSSLIFKDIPLDDPTRRRPDITLAKEKLNFNPTITLNEGLEKCINYFIDKKGVVL